MFRALLTDTDLGARSGFTPRDTRLTQLARLAALAVCLATPLSACSAQPSEPAEITDIGFSQEQVDDLAKAFLENGNYTGVAVAIMKEGELVFERGYGLASLEGEEKVKADTIFPIGSITKSFTGLAVAQLAAQGKIDLEASIASYIPDLPEGWEGIKVRHLLDHTAGIFNYTNDPSIQANPGEDRSVADMRAIWETRPLAFEPGSQWAYSNAGYFLLGLIIEKASGQSYAEYVTQRIVEPFGLTKTTYPEGVKNKPGARGYSFRDGEQAPMPEWSPTIPYSAGALLSTPGDVARYIDAIHHSPAISDEARDIIYTRRIVSGERMTYSLGGCPSSPLKVVSVCRTPAQSGDTNPISRTTRKSGYRWLSSPTATTARCTHQTLSASLSGSRLAKRSLIFRMSS